MNVIYISDNRNRENWGCRATSIALKDLISQNNTIQYTIYGNIVSGGSGLLSGGNSFFIKKLHRLFSMKQLQLVKLLYKQFRPDFISENIEKSMKFFIQKSKKNIIYKKILQKINECDAIMINGEGDAIFSKPSRRNFLFLLMIIKIAQNNNKKVFYLNAMFSDCPKSGRNMNILRQVINIFSACTLVVARDMGSFDYLNQFKHNINLKYVPDALFSWCKYDEYMSSLQEYQKALIPFPEYDRFWDSFDFTQPYICVSGSSSAAWTPYEASIGYTKLVQALKQLNYKLFIIPTCSGDQFLNDIADQTQIPIVPVNTNILGGMAILANATVFVSGRWHPSILASLGGTPCVILGSNSHKTISFLNMMGYENKKEYNAIPTEEEIFSIVNEVRDYVQQGITLREKIKSKAKELSVLTDFYRKL